MNPNLVEILSANVGHLALKDQDFAKSLIAYHAKHGKLSDKQAFWVKTLVDRLLTPKPATPSAETLGDFAGVLKLFENAKSHLKHPKIVLDTDGGKKIQLAVAGPASKYAGQITVTSEGAYGSNVWYGVVTKDGALKTSTTGAAIKDDLTGILTKLAKNPAATAASYGKKVGHCCFCKKGLTTPESLTVGYGPICAEHYNLPWGHVGKIAA